MNFEWPDLNTIVYVTPLHDEWTAQVEYIHEGYSFVGYAKADSSGEAATLAVQDMRRHIKTLALFCRSFGNEEVPVSLNHERRAYVPEGWSFDIDRFEHLVDHSPDSVRRQLWFFQSTLKEYT